MKNIIPICFYLILFMSSCAKKILAKQETINWKTCGDVMTFENDKTELITIDTNNIENLSFYNSLKVKNKESKKGIAIKKVISKVIKKKTVPNIFGDQEVDYLSMALFSIAFSVLVGVLFLGYLIGFYSFNFIIFCFILLTCIWTVYTFLH